MMVLDQVEVLSQKLDVRFAALVHDLGKATTDKRLLPSHAGHEERGCKLIESLSERMPVPRACRELGILAARYHTHCHRAFELRDVTIVKLLEQTDAFRRPERFEKFLSVCEADARGRTGLEQRIYAQADYLRGAFAAASTINAGTVAAANEDSDIPAAIRQERIAAVRQHCTTTQSTP
jgi:tRNA nucleotidyltransferase (CCA-adding enzyme)